MEILIVTGIFPPDHGGPASYVPRIAKELKDRNHRVRVVTLSDRLDLNEDFSFSVKRIKRRQNRILRFFKVVATIHSAARSADVVYLNGLVLEGVAACLLARRSFAVKVVGDLIWERATRAGATSRSLDEFQQDTLPPKWSFLRALQAWYTSKAARVIVPSNYLRDIVHKWGVPTSKCEVVYNAVEPSGHSMPTVPAYDIVTVARLVPWKGVSELIAACGDLGFSLRIVGDGPLRNVLEQEAAPYRDRISFAGHVPPAMVEQEIRNARLFVLNSTYEGLPHIVLEAKMLGVCVVATDAGGTGETITHNVDGWLVPVGDEVALRNALVDILDDDRLRKSLAEAGANQVRQQFSYNTMIRQTEGILIAVANERGP